MLISTQTANLAYRFGVKEALRIIKNAGFDCADISMFNKEGDYFLTEGGIERAKEVKEYADSIGIILNQAHAPFSFPPEIHNNFKEMLVPLIIKAIEVCSVLGVDTLVVHPIHHIPYKDNKEKLREINMEYYRILLPHAKKAGVRICLENMFQWNSVEKKIIPSVCGWDGGFVDYFDTLNDETFTCCLDIGHCGLVGTPAEECIHILGKRIGALHVHDNDNVLDNHRAIGMGKLNWDAIAKALADIDYQGVFTLEADCSLNGIQDEYAHYMTKYMYDTAKSVVDKIEYYKNNKAD